MNHPSHKIIAWFGVAICTACVLASFAHAQSDTADWQKAAGGKMSFEVASIKQNTSEPTSANFRSNVPLSAANDFAPTGGLFSASNQWFVQYIVFAFKLTQYQYRAIEKQLPNWASNSRYDVQARASADPTKDQYRLMVQSLLADRFKLRTHFEPRQTAVFELIVDKPGKLGPKLQKHPPDQPCQLTDSLQDGTVQDGFPMRCGIVVPMKPSVAGRARFGARDAKMAFIADWLMSLAGSGIDKPVIDKTGLGNVDFAIEYSPRLIQDPTSNPDPNASTFLEALKDQLGLKLVSTTGTVSTFVIDHIEQPTPN